MEKVLKLPKPKKPEPKAEDKPVEAKPERKTFVLSESEKLAIVQADELARSEEAQAKALAERAHARRYNALVVLLKRCGLTTEDAQKIEWKTTKEGIPESFSVG